MAIEADELEVVLLDSLLSLEPVVVLETCFDSDELVGTMDPGMFFHRSHLL